MVSVRVIFLRRFYFFFKSSLLYFWGVFNKTIIPLALVGYETIIANSALCALTLCACTQSAEVVSLLESTVVGTTVFTANCTDIDSATISYPTPLVE